MSFDLAATLRRLKPEKRSAPLKRRDDAALRFVTAPISAGTGLLLDTCVYIDVLQDRAPASVKDLLTVRSYNHSSIALAEMLHLFGRLDPKHRDTAEVLARIAKVVAAMAAHRLTAPSIQALADAAIVAGVVSRLTGISKSDRQPLLNDATLLMQATESGLTLLTRNVADFDLIEQVTPAARVLFYRQAP